MEETTTLKSIRFVNRDLLKYVALFLMVTGHLLVFTGTEHYSFIPSPLVQFFVYGEFFAPPTFFFFISEGFIHTRSRKKYAIRLAIIAVITQIPFYFCHFSDEPIWKIFTEWNIMASLLAGLLVLMVWESKLNIKLRIFLMLLITGATFLITSEWMIFAPVAIFLLYILRDKPYWRLFALELLYLIHQFIVNGFVLLLNINCFGFFIAETCAMLVITFFYNGKKGHFPKFSKWIFYVFYPAHLIAAILINTFVF